MLLKFTRICFLFKTFLALLTIYDSADGNSFLQFLEAASSGAWGVQQKRLEYSRFAWIRLYSSKRRSVQERHSGDLACASHTSLKEWDRFRISREETAMQITWNAPFLYSMARVPPGCANRFGGYLFFPDKNSDDKTFLLASCPTDDKLGVRIERDRRHTAWT